MKAHRYLALFLLAAPVIQAEEAKDSAEMLERHAEGSEKIANEQDELSADVQQLVIEQTVQQVIDLLTEVEGIMDETTDYLVETETGGETIAAQTEIIEKIHQAAKAKQEQGKPGDPGSAMMDMMERMMGKKEGEGEGKGKGKGKGKGDKPGDQAGQGQTGDSDAENDADGGDSTGNIEERTVPKAGGTAGKSLPREFQQALDAYNRGLEGKTP